MFDALRRTLNSKAVSAGNAAGLAGKLALPNETFTPPKGEVYGEFWFKTGGTKQVELGGNKSMEMTVGIFQFDIMAPENRGDGPATKIAELIRARFNRRQWVVDPVGYVNLLTANVKTPFAKPQNGFYRVIVDGTFHFFHKDPNAGDFRD